jgi:hypothetical protein
VASLNLLETLVALGEKALAVEGTHRLLGRLLDGAPPAEESEHPHFPPGYDYFRVEWERAAWGHGGDRAGEARAKRELLRWCLHSLLADLTREPRHFHGHGVLRWRVRCLHYGAPLSLGGGGRRILPAARPGTLVGRPP